MNYKLRNGLPYTHYNTADYIHGAVLEDGVLSMLEHRLDGKLSQHHMMLDKGYELIVDRKLNELSIGDKVKAWDNNSVLCVKHEMVVVGYTKDNKIVTSERHPSVYMSVPELFIFDNWELI